MKTDTSTRTYRGTSCRGSAWGSAGWDPLWAWPLLPSQPLSTLCLEAGLPGSWAGFSQWEAPAGNEKAGGEGRVQVGAGFPSVPLSEHPWSVAMLNGGLWSPTAYSRFQYGLLPAPSRTGRILSAADSWSSPSLSGPSAPPTSSARPVWTVPYPTSVCPRVS